MSSVNRRNFKIFLSHSGLDADRSQSLQRMLEKRFEKLGYQIKVFNTSTVEDRFKELESIITAGDDWRKQANKYDDELRQYTEQNLIGSAAYLLLVTPTSLASNSRWIRFEIDTAKSKAVSMRRPFFFPCVANGATLAELPRGAAEFQGIELESPDGLERLVGIITS